MGDNQTVVFQSALRRFTLSGRVAGDGGAAIPGVTVTLGGSEAGTTQTDAAGNYSFANLVVGRGYSDNDSAYLAVITAARTREYPDAA